MLVEKQVRNESAQSCLSQLKALNWGPIAYKLMYPESGEGWSKEQANRGISRYLIFLTLKYLYPNVGIVPTQEIDRVWHVHILDTSKYAADCEQVFGYFLHHFPYMGMRGETDYQELQSAFAQTQSLFAEHFGIPMTENLEVETKSVFCILKEEESDTNKASFCILKEEEADTAKASFCILKEEEADTAKASFCILKEEEADTAKASFCILKKLADAERPQVKVEVDPATILGAKVS